MKKLFTLALALLGFAGVSNAATVDDLKVCEHSLVFCCQDYVSGGRTKGALFGNGFFLDVTGGSVGTKGCFALEDYYDGKYAGYTTPSQSLRLKNQQDVIAMKITAGSKLIILGEKHASRGPRIHTVASVLDSGELAASTNTAETNGIFEWVADDDRTIYIGSNNDYFISWIVVEANEAPGTPSVTVSDQAYDGNKNLWFREVTCKPNAAQEDGGDPIETFVTYTTDGTAPTLDSPIYDQPIVCYDNTTVKFQAYYNWGNPTDATEDDKIAGADVETYVDFKFNAPAIAAKGANVTITSEYAGKGATNYYILNGGEAKEGDATSLEESTTVNAYTVINHSPL